jgi:predicted amidohydrolase YtcJ
VIDLQGRRVMPSFNDSHVHFVDSRTGLASVQLRDAQTPEEFRDRTRDFAAKLPEVDGY